MVADLNNQHSETAALRRRKKNKVKGKGAGPAGVFSGIGSGSAKGAATNGVTSNSVHGGRKVAQDGNSASSTTLEDVRSLLRGVWFLMGLGFMVAAGAGFAWYCQTLHENNMWFSNIQEVEREISLRTESGLYYSYYKQLINAKGSWAEQIYELTHDNRTEHGRTVNILQRFNVYQEVALAVVYKMFNMGNSIQHMLFYVYSIFKLNGFYVSVLFATAWYLTGMWPAGLLAALQFTANLEDTTRVFFTINLRESFAFPFLYAQIFFVCVYMDRRISGWIEQISKLGILLFTFLFGLTWQFNQFILLIQALSFFVLGALQLTPTHKVWQLLLMQAIAMLGVGAMQFFQPMILGSILLSFIPAAILMLWIWRNMALTGGILEGAFRVGTQLFLVLALTGGINWAVKRYLINVEADEHIFKFIKGKFGFGNPLDFESRLYLCHGAFVFLENEFFRRTTYTMLFPTYFITMLGCLFLIGKNLLLEWCAPMLAPELERREQAARAGVWDISNKAFMLNQRPYLAYLSIQSVIAGIVALMTLRMKYFWTPHMVLLGAVGLADYEIWYYILSVKKQLRKSWLIHMVRYGITFAVVGYLLWHLVPKVRREMNDLREFWDPDTSDLMYWIGNNTSPEASFAGSMQLLAGVKCCTGRHLINHPHFEDKWLRERTRKVYQMYGRRQPEEVHRILREVDAHYIILEDSICLSNRQDNCRLPDIVDLDNGHVPDNGFAVTGLRKVEIPRFCDEIRYGAENYTKYFKLVMENRTFRVYEVLDASD